MKLFGSLKELLQLVFRKDSQEITLRPNQTSTYTAARDVQIPEGDADHVLISRDSTDTLTNKTIDANGTGNSISNLETADLAAGVLNTSTSMTGASDTQVPSALAIKTYVDDNITANDEFTELSDTPANYTGSGDKIIKVNNGETALEFGGEVGGTASGDIVTIDASQVLTGKSFDADGAGNSLTNIDDGNIKAAAGIAATKIADGSVDNTEFQRLNAVGGNAAGDIVDIDTADQLLSGKHMRDMRWRDELASISSGVLALPTETISRVDSIVALSEIAAGADGRVIAVWNNHATDDLVITNDATVTTGKAIYTGSGLDLRLKAGATVLFRFDSSNDAWYAVGGAGGGGGLTLEKRTASFTAVQGFHYLLDSSGGPLTVTLPAGAEQAVIRLSDISDSWGTNNITVTPDGAETIDGASSLTLDVEGVWVQLMWDGTQWVTDDPIDPALVSGGGMETADNSSGDVTVASGRTRMHPYLRILPADTYDVRGRLLVDQTLTVDGSLAVTGSVVVEDTDFSRDELPGLATSSEAGLLSAYDEGTFTMAEAGKSNLTGSAFSGSGKYVRIGNLVHCYVGDITGYTVGSNSSTRTFLQVSLTGLPGSNADRQTISGTGCVATAANLVGNLRVGDDSGGANFILDSTASSDWVGASQAVNYLEISFSYIISS